MFLVIDIGNTNIVFAVYDGDNMTAKWRVNTITGTQADIYNELFLTNSGGQVRFVAIASVVPDVTPDIISFIKKYLKCDYLEVNSKTVSDIIQVVTDNPDEVGADRIINAIAVKKYFPNNVIVVDFGTATTFDVVDNKGRYIGGVIAPGINLSLEALHMATAKLPRIGVAEPSSVIGKNTVAAMQSGIYWGYIGLIEGTIKRIKSEMGCDMKVVATGGLAGLFSKNIVEINLHDDNLTLDGLRELCVGIMV